MTPLDMHIRFQRIASQLGVRRPVPSEDVFYYLNLSQEEVVRGRYSGRSRVGRPVEASQEVIDDLEKILLQNTEQSTEYLSEFSYQHYRADRAPLPSDRLWILSIRTESIYKRGGLEWETSNGKRVPMSGQDPVVKDGMLRHVQSQSLYRLLVDPYNTTIVDEPLGQQSEEHAVVYTDETFIVDKVYISYLKKPRTIVRGKTSAADQTCELPEILHKEVVQTAVQLYINSNAE